MLVVCHYTLCCSHKCDYYDVVIYVCFISYSLLTWSIRVSVCVVLLFKMLGRGLI